MAAVGIPLRLIPSRGFSYWRAVAYSPMMLGLLAQGVASAFRQTPWYPCCSRHQPHPARYQHLAPPAAFPQYRLDGAGTSLFRWGVDGVCGRCTLYGGQAPTTIRARTNEYRASHSRRHLGIHFKYNPAAHLIRTIPPHLQLINNTESTL